MRAKTREKGRSHLLDPRPGWTSRPSYGSVLADVLRKEEGRDEKKTAKKDRDGKERGKGRDGGNAEAQDKKKHRKLSEPSKPRKTDEARSASKVGAALARSQPVAEEKGGVSVSEEGSEPRNPRPAEAKEGTTSALTPNGMRSRSEDG